MGVGQLDAAKLLIYDVALDRSRWPALLSCLSTLFKSHFADSFCRTIDYSHFEGVAIGLDERDYQEEFLGHWATRNVWGTRRPPIQAGDVLTTREITPVADLVRSEMYIHYLGPRDLHEGLRLDIRADAAWVEDISLLRSKSAGPYSMTERRMAQALMPHLQRSCAVSERLRTSEQSAATSLMTLDQLQTAILLLDRNGRMVHRNAAAARLLAEADGLHDRRGMLVASSGPQNAAMHGLIAAAAGRHAGDGGQAGRLRLLRPSGQPPLSLDVMPLRPDAGLAHGASRVLMCISTPRQGADAKIDTLRAMFTLTATEASLAADLLAGMELRAIAARQGRSIHTVRTHLASLLSKTGTHRQAELVSCLVHASGQGRS